MRKILLTVALALLSTAALAAPRVVDGDTIDFDGVPVRILSIDTPETWNPRCKNELALGLLAKQRLQQLVDAGDVRFEATGYDRFGRVLANVFAGKIDVAKVLLEEGYALPYVPGPEAKAKRLATWCPKELP
jgi:micrococcal nuclease